MALGPVTITPYKERLARRAFVKGHTVLSNDLNGVECPMATPSAENLDPCVVTFYERGTSGNNFIRKEKFRAVLNRNYKTLKRIRQIVR